MRLVQRFALAICIVIVLAVSSPPASGAIQPATDISPRSVELARPSAKAKPGTLAWRMPARTALAIISGGPLKAPRRIDLSKTSSVSLPSGSYSIAGAPSKAGTAPLFANGDFTIEPGKKTTIRFRIVKNEGTVAVDFALPTGAKSGATVTLTSGRRTFTLTPSKGTLKVPAGLYDVISSSVAIGDGKVALGVPNLTAVQIQAGRRTRLAVTYNTITADSAVLIPQPKSATGPIEYLRSITTAASGLKVGDAVVLQASEKYPYGFYGRVARIEAGDAIIERTKPLDIFQVVEFDGTLTGAAILSAALNENARSLSLDLAGNQAGDPNIGRSVDRSCSAGSLASFTSNLNTSLGSRTFRATRENGIEVFKLTIVLSNQMHLTALKQIAIECGIEVPLVPNVPIGTTGLFLSAKLVLKAGLEMTIDSSRESASVFSPRVALALGLHYTKGLPVEPVFRSSIRLGSAYNPLQGEDVWVDASVGGGLIVKVNVGPDNDLANLAVSLNGEITPHIITENAFGPNQCWKGVLDGDLSLNLEASALWGGFSASTTLVKLSDYLDLDQEYDVDILGAVRSTC